MTDSRPTLPAPEASIDTSRRTLLTALCSLAAIAALPADWTVRLLTMDGLEAVLQRIRTAPGAIAIADAWFARERGAVSYVEMRNVLISDIGASGEHLGEKIANDFVEGRMLIHDGWPISETEARLCALARLARA